MKALIKFLMGWLMLAALPAAAQTVEYIHTDALGTPIAVTDANRVVVERSEYEPYGKPLNRPLTDGPGFTGHVQDAATGLTYMQQRYYDPGIGRFLSVDPVTANNSSGANFNRYWYANNNPYKFTDPDGRIACKSMSQCYGIQTIQVNGPSRKGSRSKEGGGDVRSNRVQTSRLMRKHMETKETPTSREMSLSLTISPKEGIDEAMLTNYAETAEAGWDVTIVGDDGIVRKFDLNLTKIPKNGNIMLMPCTPEACGSAMQGAADVGGPRIWLGTSRWDNTPVHEFGHSFGFVNNRPDGTGSIMSGDSGRGVNQSDFDLLWDAYHGN